MGQSQTVVGKVVVVFDSQRVSKGSAGLVVVFGFQIAVAQDSVAAFIVGGGFNYLLEFSDCFGVLSLLVVGDALLKVSLSHGQPHSQTRYQKL